MKKRIALLTLLILVFALVFTSCNSPQEVVPVSSVEITNKGLKDNNGTPYAVITLGKDGTAQFLIEYKVSPDNATDRGVRFAYDTTNQYVSIDEKGLVTISGPTYVKISVIATDGTNAQADIILLAKLPS